MKFRQYAAVWPWRPVRRWAAWRRSPAEKPISSSCRRRKATTPSIPTITGIWTRWEPCMTPRSMRSTLRKPHQRQDLLCQSPQLQDRLREDLLLGLERVQKGEGGKVEHFCKWPVELTFFNICLRKDFVIRLERGAKIARIACFLPRAEGWTLNNLENFSLILYISTLTVYIWVL